MKVQQVIHHFIEAIENETKELKSRIDVVEQLKELIETKVESIA